jgi:hypothetical protein
LCSEKHSRSPPISRASFPSAAISLRQPPDAAHAVDAKLHDDISAMIDMSDSIVMIP